MLDEHDIDLLREVREKLASMLDDFENDRLEKYKTVPELMELQKLAEKIQERNIRVLRQFAAKK